MEKAHCFECAFLLVLDCPIKFLSWEAIELTECEGVALLGDFIHIALIYPEASRRFAVTAFWWLTMSINAPAI
jgi:hypothetical protein